MGLSASLHRTLRTMWVVRGMKGSVGRGRSWSGKWSSTMPPIGRMPQQASRHRAECSSAGALEPLGQHVSVRGGCAIGSRGDSFRHRRAAREEASPLRAHGSAAQSEVDEYKAVARELTAPPR